MCASIQNTWIAIKIWGQHASKPDTIYINGGHVGFNYTNSSLNNGNAIHDNT